MSPPARERGGQFVVSVAVAVIVGLVIAAVAITVPYWMTHRHMRPQHDPAEMQAYLDATGRSAESIDTGAEGQPLDTGTNAGRVWQAAHAGVHPETGEPDPKTGSAGWPEGTG
jgi:hypothetical protein